MTKLWCHRTGISLRPKIASLSWISIPSKSLETKSSVTSRTTLHQYLSTRKEWWPWWGSHKTSRINHLSTIAWYISKTKLCRHKLIHKEWICTKLTGTRRRRFLRRSSSRLLWDLKDWAQHHILVWVCKRPRPPKPRRRMRLTTMLHMTTQSCGRNQSAQWKEADTEPSNPATAPANPHKATELRLLPIWNHSRSSSSGRSPRSDSWKWQQTDHCDCCFGIMTLMWKYYV